MSRDILRHSTVTGLPVVVRLWDISDITYLLLPTWGTYVRTYPSEGLPTLTATGTSDERVLKLSFYIGPCRWVRSFKMDSTTYMPDTVCTVHTILARMTRVAQSYLYYSRLQKSMWPTRIHGAERECAGAMRLGSYRDFHRPSFLPVTPSGLPINDEIPITTARP